MLRVRARAQDRSFGRELRSPFRSKTGKANVVLMFLSISSLVACAGT